MASVLGRRTLACIIPVLLCANTAVLDLPAVSSAWARATAPGQTTGAIYFTIGSIAPERLLAVSSPDASSAMLHRSTHEGGMASMEEMDGLEIPPGKTIVLAPGALHVMLTGLKHPLVAGGKVELVLFFKGAGTAHYKVPILPIGSQGP